MAYEGVARDLVHALKFHAHLAAAEVMAAQMVPGLARLEAHEGARLAAAPLVPVPFAPGRRRTRGFDPAELLASRLSARTAREVVRCLRRRGDAPRQVGAVRQQRLRAAGMEAAGRAPPVAILVDDVHTTGATLDACARALASAGTRTVFAVTYARTVRPT